MWFQKKQFIIALVLMVLVILSMVGTDFDLRKITWGNMLTFMNEWFPPDWSIVREAVSQTVITLEIAFLGTFLAILIALPASFLASRNIAGNPYIYHFIRGTFSFLRSVPEIVFALFFVTALGLGAFPAVLAILLHNIGVLGKLISELVEAAETGPMEAVQAAGGDKFLVAAFGVIPQIFPNILSHYFYRLEVAVRASLILGFISAAGLGNLLFIHFKLFDYAAVTVDVIFIMVLVMVIDYLGAYTRSRVI